MKFWVSNLFKPHPLEYDAQFSLESCDLKHYKKHSGNQKYDYTQVVCMMAYCKKHITVVLIKKLGHMPDIFDVHNALCRQVEHQ